MPLPQKVITKLSEERASTPGWYTRLLMLTGGLLVFSVVVYAGFVFGYKPYLESKLNDLNNKIQKLSQEIPEEDRAGLVNFYSRMMNINSLLESHIATSNLFNWLEKNTQVNVFFTKLSINIKSDKLALTGMAKSPNDASEQIIVFQKQPEVKWISAGDIKSVSNNLWQFNVSIILSKDFLTKLLVEQTDTYGKAGAVESPSSNQ